MLGEPDAVRPAADESSDVDDAAPARPGAVAIAAVGVILGGWFVVAWWVLGTPLVDAIGAAAGGALLVLVVVSVIGAVRGSWRR